MKRVLRGIKPLRAMYRRYADGRLDKQTIAFIDRFFDATVPVPTGNEVGFVIEPWPADASLPSFIIAFALAFVGRGKKVCLIWDDIPFGPDSRSEKLLQGRIGRLVAHLPPQIRLLRLSECGMVADSVVCEKDLETLARANGIRQYLSETPSNQGEAFEARTLAMLKESAGRAEVALRSSKFDYLVVPGGIYRTTGVFVHLGKALGLRVATFDSGHDILMISTDGVAAYLDDIPRALGAIKDNAEFAIEEGKLEFAKRCQGRDAFSSQAVPARDAIPASTILMPLNLSFDTAALGRHRAFKDQTEWMLETVGWILAKTSESVTVRRHPAERHKHWRSGDDYQGLLRARFGASERVVYVAPDAAISTYDLLRGARLVLPHVSTVGIEAAALGVPVVSQSDSCYDCLGFVWASPTRAEYFENIRRALAGEFLVSADQQRMAWLTYYLSQCCNFYSTQFTPGRIREIVKSSPSEALGAEIDPVCSSIANNMPLSVVTHEAKLRASR